MLRAFDVARIWHKTEDPVIQEMCDVVVESMVDQQYAIAIDFDFTLRCGDYPGAVDTGSPMIALTYAKYLKTRGIKLILWTCREGAALDIAIEWCKRHDLKFDAVNQNLPERIAKWGDCRKIGADEYWDDKNVNICG